MSKLDETYEALMRSPKIDESSPLPAGRYDGTCACCFKTFIVTVERGRAHVAIHGFQRPGHGHIVGKCPGSRREPFEISKEPTEDFIEALKKNIEHLKKSNHHLRNTPPEEFTFNIKDRAQPPSAANDWNQGYKTITLKRSDPDYDRYLHARIQANEDDIQGSFKTIDFLSERIPRWKYAPENLQPAGKAATVKREKVEREKNESKTAKKAMTAQRTESQRTKRKFGIAFYLAQPSFVDYMATRPQQYWAWEIPGAAHDATKRTKKILLQGNFLGYVQEFDYDPQETLRTLKEAAKEARKAGVKVKDPP